jgi:glycosyltransferase involved in cell wall biosynthesis
MTAPITGKSALRLLFIESVADYGGGSERVSHDLAIQLSLAGHHIFFAVPREGTALPSLRAAGVECIVADIGPLPLRQPYRSLCRWLTAARLVIRTRADHTFTSVSYLAPLLGSLQLVLARPAAVHLGLVLENTPATLRWAMRFGVLGIAPSRWAMEAWAQRGWPQTRLACIANGVDLERFSPRKDRSAQRTRFKWGDEQIGIVHIGRLTPEKGVFTLLRAFSRLAANAPHVQLALFGHAADEVLVKLRALARSIGLADDRWHWHGPTAEPECVLSAADIAVIASETPETFGLSVVEAMACACPVVVSDVSTFPELIGDENHAHVFPAGSVEALARVLATLVSASSAERRELGSRLRQRVALYYPLEKAVAGYLTLFQKNVLPSSCSR